MGASQSQLDPRHVAIYRKLLAIQHPQTRLQTIDTLLGDPGIVHSAKVAGIYGQVLQYSATVRHGGASALPGEAQVQTQAQTQVYQQTPAQTVPATLAYHPTSFQQVPARAPMVSNQIVTTQAPTQTYYQQVAKPKRSEKALNFFTACLRVLSIEEEVALTEDELKKAYKKAVIKAHPDKPGGSKEAFDAVTRAYAYLVDILKLVKGASGTAGQGVVPGLDTVQEQRRSASDAWKMPEEPVKLNPKNLDMNKFNQLFESTRVPDPDEDGYGDWLKDGEGSGASRKKKINGKTFSDNFNREVFNRMFEEEQEREKESAITQYAHPQEMILNQSAGVELGRGRPDDYTAAYDSKMQFTDLKSAYTKENTVSNKIQNVRVENRDFNSYKAQRERAPDVYNPQELAQLHAYEAQQKGREQQRQLRAAQEQVSARDYFERMKQLVITEK